MASMTLAKIKATFPHYTNNCSGILTDEELAAYDEIPKVINERRAASFNIYLHYKKYKQAATCLKYFLAVYSRSPSTHMIAILNADNLFAEYVFNHEDDLHFVSRFGLTSAVIRGKLYYYSIFDVVGQLYGVPVTTAILSDLCIRATNYISTHLTRCYFDTVEELEYMKNTVFNVGGSRVSLILIILHGEECPDCGNIHFSDVCPHCEAFKIVQGYSTQVQEVLASETTDRHYGVEIEIEGDTVNTSEFVASTTSIEKKYLLCKHDGSLDRGVELVTKPASYAEHIQRMPKVLSNIKYRTSSRTGMHVHVNKDLVSETKLLRLFMDPSFHKLVDKISGRPVGYHHNGQYAHHNTNLTPTRYNCFHTKTGKGTVEFRIFGTPKTTDRFRFNMEFVKSCVDFSVNVKRIPKDKAMFRAYMDYVEDNQADFPIVTARYKRIKIEEVAPPEPFSADELITLYTTATTVSTTTYGTW